MENFLYFFKKEKSNSRQALKLNPAEWDKIEKEFLSQLQLYFSEINDSIQRLRSNESNPFIRSQLCLAFVGADTFARFHMIFNGQRDDLDSYNERRFKKWFNTFVFTEENNIYRQHRRKIKCDAGIVWRFRNSLLHFYSLPHLKDERYTGITFNFSDELRQKLEIGFKKDGHKVIIIDAYFLIEAILRGFLLQLQHYMKMIKDSPNQYIDAVLFAHKIVMREGASTIDLKKGNIQQSN